MKNDEVKKKFAKVIFNAKMVALVFFVLLTPSIVLKVKGMNEIFGLSEQTWFNAAIAGFIIYIGYTIFFWKCPKCGKFPGRGWFRKKCDSCGVELS